MVEHPPSKLFNATVSGVVSTPPVPSINGTPPIIGASEAKLYPTANNGRAEITTRAAITEEKSAANAISALGGATSTSQQEIEERLIEETHAAMLAKLTATEEEREPTWLKEERWLMGRHAALLWHPPANHDSGNADGSSPSAGEKKTAGYNDLRLENSNPLNISPLTDGVIKVGSIVIFGRGRKSTANHAAMCIGFDPETHKPIWVSDAVQNQATVNARSRNGEYTIYNPPEGFNASKAAEYIRALAKIRTDASRKVIGTKSEREFTKLCWQHVSMAISYGLGHAIDPASRASIAHAPLSAAGFTPVAGGRRGAELDLRVARLAGASLQPTNQA